MNEFSDRRVLAGFRCVDGITGLSIVDPFPVSSDRLQIRQNFSGVYAVLDGPGFHPLTGQLKPKTPWPGAAPFELTIEDPHKRYLPRRTRINAPQAPDISSAPQNVVMFPGPAATVDLNWAAIFVSVANTAVPAQPLPWAVVQVLDPSATPATVLATGLADARGEALVAVPGLSLQVSSSGGGAVTEKTTPVSVRAWFDPGVANKPKDWIPNPDDILGNLANPALKTDAKPVDIAPGFRLFITVSIPT